MKLRGRGLLRRVRRVVEMPDDDRRLLARAFLALTVVDLRLHTQGFRRLVESSQRLAVSGPEVVGAEDLERAYRYAEWLDVASRYHFVRAQCLHRSLALHRWLRDEGLPSELRIGVRRECSSMEAHAWVELGGSVVGDPPLATARFTPLVGVTSSFARSTHMSGQSPRGEASALYAGRPQ